MLARSPCLFGFRLSPWLQVLAILAANAATFRAIDLVANQTDHIVGPAGR